MAHRSFTDAQLVAAADTSQHVDEIVEKLGSVASRRTVLQHLRRINHVAYETMPRSASLSRWNSSGPTRRPIEELLIRGVDRNTVNLKNRLFSEGLKERKCENCGLVEWLGLPAPLQLDHKDGDRTNNLIENLRILCPNCHSMTVTFCGKNTKRVRARKMNLPG